MATTPPEEGLLPMTVFRWYHVAIVASLLAGPSVAAAEKPNVIVVLIDDLGHTDLGCQGNTFHETPHLDKLAASGMRFTSAYSACTVCSPTRAALLTGQYPARLHLTDFIAGHVRPYAKLKVPDWTKHLPTDTFTLAKLFKSDGYTTASMGKWHLGGPANYPEKHGFDNNVGGSYQGQPGKYFPPYGITTLKDGPDGEFLTDRLTTEACDWIEKNKEKPFFLYLAHYAVHTPLGGKPAVVSRYQEKAKRLGIRGSAVYAALVESVDDSVGAIRQKLDQLKIADRTILLFTSDNGGLIGNPKNPITTNQPFRAGKGSAYEGGVRVPSIAYWPGVTKPGTRCDVPVMTIDFFPTLAEVCGLRAPASHVVDGESILGLLKQTGGLKRDALYWHYPHYHPGGATPYSAIRAGDWRLVEFFEDGRAELYDLKSDVAEKKDLSGERPEKVRVLRERLAEWRKKVGAQMPSANPDYDAKRANR
jgi:arylsulfatase A-like enzyme